MKEYFLIVQLFEIKENKNIGKQVYFYRGIVPISRIKKMFNFIVKMYSKA